MMRERVTIPADPDLRNLGTGSLVASVEGDYTRNVGLQSEDDDVVHRSQMLSELLQIDIAAESRSSAGVDFGAWRLELRFGPPGAYFDLPHRGQILVKSAAVLKV